MEAEDPLQWEPNDIVGKERVPGSLPVLPETSHGPTGHAFVAIEEQVEHIEREEGGQGMMELRDVRVDRRYLSLEQVHNQGEHYALYEA